MSNIKKIIPTFAKPLLRQLPSFLLIVIACILLGTILLSATFAFFPQISTKHIENSAYTFVGKPGWENIFEWCYNALDNWTDALILQISADNRSDNILNRALLAYHGTNESDDGNPASAIIKHFIDGNEYDNPDDTYGRYWHGYILFIRPLLSVMSYSQIRILNAIIQSILTLVIIFLLFRKKLKYYIFPYVLSILLLNPIIQAMSLQYSPCFYIFSFGSIVVIALSDKHIDPFFPYLFLLIGISTSFFDFLTYPISTLGIPLTFYLCRIERNKFSNLIICIITWGIGYAGMWAGKWIVADIFTNEHVLSNAILGVQIRTASSYLGIDYSLAKTLYENFKYFFKNPITLLSIPFIAFCIIHYFQNKQRNKKDCLYYSIPYFLICLFPVIWYAFALNHSAIHSIFTHKSCVVTCFSLLCLLSRLSFACPTSKSGTIINS